MSLSLLQSYSSEEEEEESEHDQLQFSDDENEGSQNRYKSLFDFDPPKPSSAGESSLPSVFDAFSEVSGPPQFLNNCVEEPILPASNGNGQRWRHGGRRNRKEKRDLPEGAVMEAKPQLVGTHERVRSDIEGNLPPKLSAQPTGSSSTTQGGIKRVATAANPNAEDAAELLRMCLQCGIPKTFSNARGMVCPVCGDRPTPDANNEQLAKKKEGSTIKDKEKNKRMKGQSSHATWKSETEMQLRQQFD